MLRMDLPGGVLRRFYAQNGPPRVGFKVVFMPRMVLLGMVGGGYPRVYASLCMPPSIYGAW